MTKADALAELKRRPTKTHTTQWVQSDHTSIDKYFLAK